MENDELGESRTTLRRTCGILGPCPLLREKPNIIIIIIILCNLLGDVQAFQIFQVIFLLLFFDFFSCSQLKQ